MIYSKRHQLNGCTPIDPIATHVLPMVPCPDYSWKPAKSINEALQRMLSPTSADLEHDRRAAKALGLVDDGSALDYINVDMFEQHLSTAIEDFLADVSQEKVLITNQVDHKNNGIYIMSDQCLMVTSDYEFL